MRHVLIGRRFLVALVLYGCCALLTILGNDDNTSFAQSPTQQPVDVELALPMLPEYSPGAAVDESRTALVVASGGASKTLEPSADTVLVKERDDSRAAMGGIALRDNRYTQALFRFDLSKLDKNTAIDSATFRFKAGKSERPGNARMVFYRMLVDWSEDAGWNRPFPGGAATWNGLKSGRDFAAEPIATYETDDWKAGEVVTVPGFEKVLTAWRDGAWPNHGLMIAFYGKSIQVSIPSREAETPVVAPNAVGGPVDAGLVLRVNTPLLRHVLAKDTDLHRATIELRPKVSDLKDVGDAQLTVFAPSNKKAHGEEQEFSKEPILNVPLAPAAQGGVVVLPGLEKLIAAHLDQESLPLLLKLAGTKRPAVRFGGAAGSAAERSQLKIAIQGYAREPLFTFDMRPTPGVYCKVKNDKLHYGDRRLRLWGEVGYGAADRKRKMGFNFDRFWTAPEMYDDESIKRGEPRADQRNADGTLDRFDEEFAAVKEQQMFLMYAGLVRPLSVEKCRKSLTADDSFLATGDDWDGWKKAVAGKFDQYHLTVLDDRLQRLRFKHAKNLLTRKSPKTGKTIAEDESIVIYEVWNELGFIMWALEGGLQKAPQYFQEGGRKKWNEWLAKRYGDEASLVKAWGKLEVGESLATSSIAWAPQMVERSKYPEQRGRDFVRFLIETLNDFNQRFRAQCRSCAPTGVGVNVVPFSFDTQYRPNIPWVYGSAQGDVNCFGMYFWGTKETLTEPPSMYVIDNHAVDGVPTVLYETNQGRPSSYRADYPFRIAAYASWQDWDGVVFHYWGGLTKEGTPDEEYLLQPLRHRRPDFFWSAVENATDPVMCAAMASAGRMFLSGAVKPAIDPAIYEVSGKTIFGFEGIYGVRMSRDSFSRGARIRFAPDKDASVLVDGAEREKLLPWEPAIQAGDGLTWDWWNGRMIVDTPAYKAYVGRISGAYQFRDGTAISDVNQRWVAFGAAAVDGKPFVGPDATKKIQLTAVFDAKNTDFKIDPNFKGSQHADVIAATQNIGRAPVVVDNVGYTFSLPNTFNGRFDGFDFALRKAIEHPLSDTNRIVCPASELFLGMLHIDSRGGPASTPKTSIPIATQADLAKAPPVAEGISAPSMPLDKTWCPIPGIGWNMAYSDAYQALRAAKFPHGVLSGADPDQLSMTLSEAEVLWDTPADLTLIFTNRLLTKIEVEFTRPPSLQQAAADYERQFGKPVEKEFRPQMQVSIVRWTSNPAKNCPAVALTESQGIMHAVYERK